MASNILSIGQSALAAAQVGLSTTGHNIANAATPGYNRQVVVQSAALAQQFGYGFLGQGTEISTIKRIYSDYLGIQVQSAQASKSGIDSYAAQIGQIDNLLADTTSGLSPALQAFFSGIQDVATNPTSLAARQSALSAADALAARVQSLAGRLDEIGQGVNSQISASVATINAQASQIAQLNDAISRAQASTGQPPNDLLDQRDQLVLDLNTQIKATVVKQDDGSYNVFIGNGQPLVTGNKTFALSAVASPDNPQQTVVAYQGSSGTSRVLADTALTGGALGGVLAFRSSSLGAAQNALGRIAIGLADSFNAQHQAGFDLNGAAGVPFFSVPAPQVIASTANTGTATLSAAVSSSSALTTSDYRVQFDGSQYTITRLADNTSSSFASLPQTLDGIDFNLAAGSAAAGDRFLIRPTALGASGFAVAISDPAAIAAAGQTGATGDNANALLLADLQTAKTLAGGQASFQGAYTLLVSEVGNKTRELQVTGQAAASLLSESTASLQSQSGVNLDEEATNLLRYQQAYQAAGKVMQIASEIFDTLLNLG